MSRYPKRVFTFTFHRGGDPFNLGTIVVVARVLQRAEELAREEARGDAETVELEKEEPLYEPMTDGGQVVYSDRTVGP